MTKKELLGIYRELLIEKDVPYIEGINTNSSKSQIENAIRCLELTDEELDEYMIVLKLMYNNTYNVIINNGDWKKHQYNRFYVYSLVNSVICRATHCKP